MGKIEDVQLGNTPYMVAYNLTTDGLYSVASTQEIKFFRTGRQDWSCQGLETESLRDNQIFFMWLLLQNILWTADRLNKRGWPHNDACCICDQTLETTFHLAFECMYAKEVWTKFLVHGPILMRAIGMQDQSWIGDITFNQDGGVKPRKGYVDNSICDLEPMERAK